MGQHAATNIAPQLVFDVAGQVLAAFFAHGREEGLELLAYDEMQDALSGSRRA
jgi:hypothetical protein